MPPPGLFQHPRPIRASAVGPALACIALTLVAGPVVASASRELVARAFLMRTPDDASEHRIVAPRAVV